MRREYEPTYKYPMLRGGAGAYLRGRGRCILKGKGQVYA